MFVSKKFLAVLFAMLLSFSFVVPTFAAITTSETKEVKVLDEDDFYWEKDEDGEWICTDEFGDAVNGWALRDDHKYFIKEGKIKTGWVKDKGNWYYLYTEKDDVKKELVGTLAVDTWIDNYYVDKNGAQKKIKK